MPRFLTILIMTGILSAAWELARAEVVVVVSDDSPIEALSETQLADIYLGRLTRLPDGTSITPIDQAEQSSGHSDFYNRYLGRTAAQIRAHWSRLIFTGRGQPPKAVANDDAMADALGRNPNAIGYMDAEAVPDGLRIIDIGP